MKWNWQLKDWPNYHYKINEIASLDHAFLKASGAFVGVIQFLDAQAKQQLQIELLSEEALNTSAIEGEYLNRDSLQASIRHAFGLTAEKKHITQAEKGIAQMMKDAYVSFAKPLDHQTLFTWHSMMCQGRKDLDIIGDYRQHADPMLIVSHTKREPTIHFEAPASAQVETMMNQFIQWFNDSSPQGKNPLPTLIRAGIAHLYFETIHPFEDGNGRIGRAIVEKTLSQSLEQPTLIAVSYIIERHKKEYYAALQTTNHSLDITSWLQYFGNTVLAAQTHTQNHIHFLVNKTKFFDKHDHELNDRQRKVIHRIFREGLEGFKGGLSAENYISITQTSRATATRDLQDLVMKNILKKEGELKHTRYYLNVENL